MDMALTGLLIGSLAVYWKVVLDYRMQDQDASVCCVEFLASLRDEQLKAHA